MNSIEKIISALEKRLKIIEEKCEEAHRIAAGYLELKKMLDEELDMIRTAIFYLKNYCINTLKVE